MTAAHGMATRDTTTAARAAAARGARMKLTPLDIRHKEFKRAMRGYADVEVDEFLDEVADEFERIFKENIDLRERLEVLEDQVAGYKRIEETLQKTLISAQASADELKQNSTREAQLILHEAELQARQLVNEAYTRAAGHRAGHGPAAERRAGLPLQVPPAAAGLPRAHRGGAGERPAPADADGAGGVRAPRRGRSSRPSSARSAELAPRRRTRSRRAGSDAAAAPERDRRGRRQRRPSRPRCATSQTEAPPEYVDRRALRPDRRVPAQPQPGPGAAADARAGAHPVRRDRTTCWPTSTPG